MCNPTRVAAESEMKYAARYAILLLLSCAAGTAVAKAPRMTPGEFDLCPVNPVLAPVPATPGGASGTVYFRADSGWATRSGTAHFQGHAVATRGRRRVWANLIDYSRHTQILDADGHLRYASPTLGLRGTHGRYDFRTDRGIFWDDIYTVPASHGRGKARRIATQGSRRTFLEGLTYTTCPPQNPAWQLHASHVVLNHDTEIGYATNAWITFKHVPFLWMPYLSFPLTNARKSGFLAPSIARSSSSGLDLEVPYYWNIAPNLDTTTTLRYLSERGVMGIDTTRWLLPGTRGQFHIEYLPHDRVDNRTRGLAELRNASQVNSHWRVDTSLEYVSDANYFDDFGTSLRQVAQTFATRSITATYQAASGAAFVGLEDDVPVNPSIAPQARPYRKLPEVGLDFAWPDYRTHLTPGLSASAIRFQAPQRQDGIRTDIRPYLQANYGSASWYVTPRLSVDAARYNLDAFGGTAKRTIDRTAPIFSLDTGLDFERLWGKGGWLTQTLEPRAYYLYVPYRNQSDIPIFDTYQPPLDMLQLFSDNRFTGLDRLGDANQISLGLTSRFINNASGQQLFTAGIGQAFYFRNRDVTLPGALPQTQARSDYVGQVTAHISSTLSTQVVGDYNPYTHSFDQGYVTFQYRPGPFQVLNLGYLYRRGALDQSNVSFAWPVTRRWSIVGRWNYSIREHQTIENMLGLQYDSCCWRFRIVERRFVTANGQGNSALYLELQLRGLGSVGNRMSDFLHNDIYGYGKNND